MAEINTPIQERGYEIVRKRIASILALELPNQSTLTNLDYLNASIWLQRIYPFSIEDAPFVNVMFAENDYTFITNSDQDYKAKFIIDVGVVSGKDGDDHMDKASAVKLHRLMGVIQAILMDAKYYSLGFDPSDGFIGRRVVESMGMVNPSTDNNASKSSQRGRIEFSVIISDISTFDNLNDLLGIDTAVYFDPFNDGYSYSQDTPIIPPVDQNVIVKVNNDILATYPPGTENNVTLRYENGNLITPLSLLPDEIILNNPISCNDASYTVENSEGDILNSGNIPSGGSSNIIINDNDVTLNGFNFLNIPAEVNENIELVDQNDIPIIPDSVVDSKITVTVGGGSIGAELMKTGQSVSVRVGDDGFFKFGRAVDEYILNGLNPFGNPYRFTGVSDSDGYTDGVGYFDSLGNPTTKSLALPNNIAIDWSTFDGVNVLGYDVTLRGIDNFNDAIDKALLLQTGGFLSGWRLPNMRAMDNLSIVGGNRRFAMPPLDLSSTNNRLWSSTSLEGYTNLPYIYLNQWQSLGSNITSTWNWIACRTFTVLGTVLL